MTEQEKIIMDTAESIKKKFLHEAEHLMKSRHYNPGSDSISTVIRVALENVAMRYDRGNSNSYKNLKTV